MALKTKYSPLQHLSFENVLTAFIELSPRNQIVALVLVGVMVLFLLFLPLSLFSGKVSSIKREINSIQKGYTQVLDKIAAYQSVRAEMSSLEGQFGAPSGSLTTKIEAVAKQGGLTVDQVLEKAPQETDYLEINSLEVRLSNVTLGQLTEFLYTLEHDKTAPLRIRRLQIKPKTANRQIMDVTCEVATFSVRKEG